MNTTTHYAGMDIHASNTVIQAIDPNGAQIQQWELPTQADQLINWARSYPHGPLQIILEQGTHSSWVASAMTPWVDRLVICDPAENALVHRGGDKNGRTDAHVSFPKNWQPTTRPVTLDALDIVHGLLRDLHYVLTNNLSKEENHERIYRYSIILLRN